MALPSPPDTNLPESPGPASVTKEELSRPTVPPQKKASTGEYLETLSRDILGVNLNLKDTSHPLVMKHMSPEFRGKHDALPKASSRDDHQDNLQKHLAEQPHFHVEVLNASSDVDESRGRATVYLWYDISGIAQGLEREAVAVLSWERKQGTWMIMKHSGMRGSSGFS